MRMHRRREQGLSLMELLISTAILSLVIVMGMFIQRNLTDSQNLARDEKLMQEHSRTAIMKIKQELAQATRFVSAPPPTSVTWSYHIQFTIPEMNSSTGVPTGKYKRIRYWYEQNTQTKIWSLKRAEKINFGPTAGYDVKPDIDDTPTLEEFTDKSTYLVHEAAVVDPGQQSYFKRDLTDSSRIEIRLVTATYRFRGDGQATTNQEHILSRVFRVETEVQARNLDS